MKLDRAELIHFLAQESEHAYRERIPEGAIPISDDHAYRGFIGLTRFGTVISIKGTVGIRDLEIDADILRGIFLGEYAVHMGFLQEFNEVWSMIRSRRFEPPICVTGHSLGGAIATLVSMALKRVEGLPVTCVTFGSPRVGDAEFAKAFNDLVFDSVRVVHERDLVPRVPKVGYQHIDTLLHLKDDGKVIGPMRSWLGELFTFGEVVLSDLDGEALRDHHVTSYVRCTGLLMEQMREKK